MHLAISQWNQFILCEIIPNVTSHTFRQSGIYRMNKNDNCLLLVLTLLSMPNQGIWELLYNHWLFWGQRCNNYQEFIVSVFLRNHLHVKIVQFLFVRTFTMMALSIILGQIMKFCWSLWSTWIIISVNCYSVTYELTYHHFPNPIESVGKSVLSSTFTPYPWLTSLIL